MLKLWEKTIRKGKHFYVSRRLHTVSMMEEASLAALAQELVGIEVTGDATQQFYQHGARCRADIEAIVQAGLLHEIKLSTTDRAKVVLFFTQKKSQRFVRAGPLQTPYHHLEDGQPDAFHVDLFLDREEVEHQVESMLSIESKRTAVVISSPRGSGKTQVLRCVLPKLIANRCSRLLVPGSAARTLVIYAPRVLAYVRGDYHLFWHAAVIEHAYALFHGTRVGDVNFGDSVDMDAPWSQTVLHGTVNQAFDALSALLVTVGEEPPAKSGPISYFALLDEGQVLAGITTGRKRTRRESGDLPPLVHLAEEKDQHTGLSLVLSEGPYFVLAAGTCDKRVLEILHMQGNFSLVRVRVLTFLPPLQHTSLQALWRCVAGNASLTHVAWSRLHSVISELLLRMPRPCFVAFSKMIALHDRGGLNISSWANTLAIVLSDIQSFYADIWMGLQKLGPEVAARVVLATHCFWFAMPSHCIPGTSLTWQTIQDMGVVFPWMSVAGAVAYTCPLHLFLPTDTTTAWPTLYSECTPDSAASCSQATDVEPGCQQTILELDTFLQANIGIRLTDLVWSATQWLEESVDAKRTTLQGSKFERLVLATMVARYRLHCPAGNANIPLASIYEPTKKTKDIIGKYTADLTLGVVVPTAQRFVDDDLGTLQRALIHNSCAATAHHDALMCLKDRDGRDIVAAVQFCLYQKNRCELNEQLLFRPHSEQIVQLLIVYEFAINEIACERANLVQEDRVAHAIKHQRLVEVSGVGCLAACHLNILLSLRALSQRRSPPSFAEMSSLMARHIEPLAVRLQ
eukprot:TRINITY_DN56_c0_g1_i15.p1 TRINITY_DN56_c0_g1~~TRINITY_DN56_c0_g1_i15.p1  ORF type:complete len:798 (-),score=85.57 TRINITY_DN56_c0_g1_i15:608-3001(-)